MLSIRCHRKDNDDPHICSPKMDLRQKGRRICVYSGRIKKYYVFSCVHSHRFVLVWYDRLECALVCHDTYLVEKGSWAFTFAPHSSKFKLKCSACIRPQKKRNVPLFMHSFRFFSSIYLNIRMVSIHVICMSFSSVISILDTFFSLSSIMCSLNKQEPEKSIWCIFA